jgi:photosystem II stability/assembly factor-like uncharacterized protein
VSALRRSLPLLGVVAVAIAYAYAPVRAQQLDTSLYSEMRWRMIGPFRGGRTVGAVGVPGQQNVFYIGVNNGGVWKSTDFGHIWKPIFDDQPTGSIGAIAVAPSNPSVVYVGSGEGLQRPDLSTGDGMYRSNDAGKTWEHLPPLRDGQQIGAILVDPKDPNRLFVAVLGHPYGPNEERGVFRSTDGGRTFEKVLYKDENTGAIALAFDPTNAQTIYADLWEARQGPWENGAFQGPNSGLFKSTDGGTTWRQLTKGLPTTEQGLGRIGFAIAPNDPTRMYATVDADRLTGLYRSDDAGESWTKMNDESRVLGRGSDFAEVKVDPRNHDVVYVANTSTYRSTDGAKTFTAIRGAPGGDDYHTIWINPENPNIILLAADQGAIITVNGGETWSSWYNQPTAQLYHVITDNRIPYWVYGGQQESGSVGIQSRGDDGQITFREWHPVGVEEYGYIAPDPLNPNITYGGKATRFDWTTKQTQNVSPDALRSGKYRFVRTMPILFSPVDPHTLYLASQVLFKTTNGGNSWQVISPDLTRQDTSAIPSNVGIYSESDAAKGMHPGVIYAIAPSYQNTRTIWAGTDDGLIHLTRDGGLHWNNVTPPELVPWSKVAQLEASHFDSLTAYAAINTFRLDDLRPHIFRTHDGGKTWTQTVDGIPDGGIVNTVREDPERKGLLFAGTERQVYVSFDDGDHWQSLRLNMPATSIRDLVVHNDDVVVGTHGRSFWILDDITPLRQLSADVAAADAHLFKPQLTYRFRRNNNTDTPLPPEEPAGKNPPDGAIIDYLLKSAPGGPVILEVMDSVGKIIRRFSSADAPDVIPTDLNVPTYWIRPQQRLSDNPGMHRFVWDLHYARPSGTRPNYPISATYMDTPPGPLGPAVPPGRYTVKLTVNGKPTTQPLVIRMDPRVKTAPAGTLQQHAVALRAYNSANVIYTALETLRALRRSIRTARANAQGELADTLAALDERVQQVEGSAGGFGGGARRADAAPTLNSVNAQLIGLMTLVEEADAAPTTQQVAAGAEQQQRATAVLARWRGLRDGDVARVNELLRAAGQQPLSGS